MSTHNDWSYLTKPYLEVLYERFGNWKDVSQHIGMEPGVLTYVRKRLGMPMGIRPAKDRRAWRKSRLEPMREKIVGMAEAGLNCGEIAREIGESDPEIVRDYLSKLGVQRQRAGARPGEKNPMWKGGMSVDKQGYILVKADGHPHANRHGYVRLHRLVMEAMLGRYLLPEEVVHHKDGDPQNNDPDNLELFDHNGSHLRQEWSNPQWAEHQREIRRGVPSRRRNHPASESDAQEL